MILAFGLGESNARSHIIPSISHRANPSRVRTDGAPDTHEISFNELWQNQKEGISFSDLLDIVNPLHHIPVVSTVYRMITGDEIGMGARMAGSVLYGGPYGIVGSRRRCRR